MNLSPTNYIEGFIEYFNKAKMLEENTFKGMQYSEDDINCPLLWNIPIYNNVHRRYAGFSNMLEDIWYGSKAPKGKSKTDYDRLPIIWDPELFTYVFLVHRITGSGASFESDHGYRNTIIPFLTAYTNQEDIIQHIKTYEKPMFTSIGNQIPLFPKPAQGYSKGGKLYLCEYAPRLNRDFWEFLRASDSVLSIRQGVDFCTDWHAKNGLKKYHFALTAFVMDFAEYFPQYIDRQGPVYLGKNAIESMSLLFDGNKNNLEHQENALNYLVEKTNTYNNPYDMEDCICDFVRYIENYLPKHGYEKFESYLVNNSSCEAVKNHKKGRQFIDGKIINFGS